MNSIIERLKSSETVTHQEVTIKNVKYKLFYILELIDNYKLFQVLSNINIIDLDSICNIITSYNQLSFDDIYYHLTLGEVLFINDKNIYYLKVSDLPKRAITQSDLDPINLFGSKEGLIEDLMTNYALIQKRIHSDKLTYYDVNVGNITKSKVRVLFLNGITNTKMLDDIKSKLLNSNLKSIKTINDISKLFSKQCLFPLTLPSSSVEVITNSLLNGRVVLLIESFPNALIVPVSIIEFTNLPDEASASKYYLFYTKTLTLLLLFISIFFLGLYISIINFHPHVLSMQLISEIITSQKGSTFPLIGEVLFVTFIFEFLRIASSKTPASFVQNLVITVGGLLIGQNTVNSGFVSPFNLVVIALSYLASYGVTNNKHLIIAFNILRILVVFASLFFGILGFVISSILIISYMVKINVYDISYFSIINKHSFKNMFSQNKERSLMK